MVIANVDDYEIAVGICGSDGAGKNKTYDLKLIFNDHPAVTIPDLDSDRDVAASFGERVKGKSLDLDAMSALLDDYLGEVYGLSF